MDKKDKAKTTETVELTAEEKELQEIKAMSLRQRMHAIMLSTPMIVKDKKNTNQNYMYASEAAIKTAIHDMLAKYRVLFMLDTVGLREEYGKTILSTEYCFLNVDNDKEMITGKFIGTGQARDDKGNYAAVTGAIKYILTSTFLIPTGNDPEADEPKTPRQMRDAIDQREPVRPTSNLAAKSGVPASKLLPAAAPKAEEKKLPEKISDDQKLTLLRLLHKKGKSQIDLNAFIKKAYKNKFESYKDLSHAQAIWVINKISELPEKGENGQQQEEDDNQDAENEAVAEAQTINGEQTKIDTT